MDALFQPVSQLKGIGQKRAEALERLGILYFLTERVAGGMSTEQAEAGIAPVVWQLRDSRADCPEDAAPVYPKGHDHFQGNCHGRRI